MDLEPVGAKPALAPSYAPHPRLKALVVDGDESDLQAMCSALRSLGVDTLTAARGHQALEVLNRHEVSILAIDWELPDINGLVLAHAARRGHATPPVIIGTARSLSEEIKDLALSTGMDYFCDKPITISELAQCLAKSGIFAAASELVTPSGRGASLSAPPSLS